LKEVSIVASVVGLSEVDEVCMEILHSSSYAEYLDKFVNVYEKVCEEWKRFSL